MKKLILYLLLFLFILVSILFIIPTVQKSFAELYNADQAIKRSLVSFRKYETKKINYNNTEWDYLSIGNGDRHVLFLHGMGGAYDIWWQQIEALKDQYHIISTTMPEVHSIVEAIEGLRAILDQEGIKKVSVIGTSMGGYMAQYFLTKYPERLDKLVLGNTFPPNDIYLKENGSIRKVLPFIPEWLIMKMFRSNLSEKVTPYSEDSPLVEAYLLEQYYGSMKKGQFIGRLDVVLDHFETDYNEDQKNIPKLIIKSDNDPLVNHELRSQLVDLYPEAEVFTFKAKGHFPYLNQAEEYTKVLSEFLIKNVSRDIEATIFNYFRGRKSANIKLLKETFHPEMKISTTNFNNEVEIIKLGDYYSMIEKQGPVACETHILSISHDGVKAKASVSFDYGQEVYLDSLTLSNIDGQWWIMEKIFEKK